jgi:hypothetical protein
VLHDVTDIRVYCDPLRGANATAGVRDHTFGELRRELQAHLPFAPEQPVIRPLPLEPAQDGIVDAGNLLLSRPVTVSSCYPGD